MSLLPHKAHGVPILRAILQLQGSILRFQGYMYLRPNEDHARLLEISHQLLQRLHFNEPVSVEFKTVPTHECGIYLLLFHKFSLHMVINNVEVCPSKTLSMFLTMYLGSLILVKLISSQHQEKLMINSSMQ